MSEADESNARAAVRAMTAEQGMVNLHRLAILVADENERQNLVARSTLPLMWRRHIWDSIQLLRWTGGASGLWIDVGTGGGFPGLAIAAVDDRPMLLVEPRRRRAEFLQAAARELGLRHVEVVTAKIERVQRVAEVISARAVSSVEKLLQATAHCATPSTRWVLPRGASTLEVDKQQVVASGRMFHVEQSLSDPASSILIVEQRS